MAHRLLEVLPRLRRRLENELPADLRDELAGATVHQVEAVCHLVDRGGMTMHELAQAQGIGLSSATALADRLLRQGLARRASDPADRRIVRLQPTERASQLVCRFVAAKRESARRLLDALDDDEAAALLELLSKMAQPVPGEAETARG